MTLTTPRDFAELYFACWDQGDPSPLRPVISPDVTFDGPLASTRGAADFIEGLTGLFAATATNRVLARLADANDVITWSELRLRNTDPVQVANWTRVESGLIRAVRVTFDPRPLFAAA